MGKKATFDYSIGQRVLVTAVTSMGYDSENNRLSFRTPLNTPQEYTVIGAVRRQLGKYKRESKPTYFDEDYTPAELMVTGTILLYQCRSSMLGKVIDVAPSDISVLEVVSNA